MANNLSADEKFIPRNLKLAVEPIRSLEDISKIREILKAENRLRDMALVDIGLNNGLRTVDIVRLKVKQVSKAKVGEKISIRESKTSKLNFIILNKRVRKSVRKWIKAGKLKDEDYLFKSRMYGGHIQSQRAGDIIQGLCKRVGLTSIRTGSHTLRKTWAYHCWKTFNVELVVIMRRLNHSDPRNFKFH